MKKTIYKNLKYFFLNLGPKDKPDQPNLPHQGELRCPETYLEKLRPQNKKEFRENIFTKFFLKFEGFFGREIHTSEENACHD